MKSNIETSATVVLVSKVGNSVVNGIDVSEIVELFSSLGYECEINARIVGTSGMEHHFDILARRGTESIVIDMLAYRKSLLDTIATEEESVEQIWSTAVQMRAKAWDCKLYYTIILHLTSNLSAEENDVISPSEDYNAMLRDDLGRMRIDLIQSSNIQGVVPRLKSMLYRTEVVA